MDAIRVSRTACSVTRRTAGRPPPIWAWPRYCPDWRPIGATPVMLAACLPERPPEPDQPRPRPRDARPGRALPSFVAGRSKGRGRAPGAMALRLRRIALAAMAGPV